MNQILAGGITLILAAAFWSFSKKPKKNLLQNSKSDLFSANQINQTSLVNLKASKIPNKVNEIDESKFQNWTKPQTLLDKIQLRKKLFKQMNLGPEERLNAIGIAYEWNHSSILGLLRRGLKDSDSRIVKLSASAIEKHKGLKSTSKNQRIRPPRNAFLTR